MSPVIIFILSFFLQTVTSASIDTTDYQEDTDLLSFYSGSGDDLNLGSVELKVSSGGRVIKGDDCQYIKLNSLTNNTDCQSGVKFVIKQQSGVRKQFLIVGNEVLMVFVKKKKKFTQCESFSDISSSVKCKTISGLATVDLSVTQSASNTTSNTNTTTSQPSTSGSSASTSGSSGSTSSASSSAASASTSSASNSVASTSTNSASTSETSTSTYSASSSASTSSTSP